MNEHLINPVLYGRNARIRIVGYPNNNKEAKAISQLIDDSIDFLEVTNNELLFFFCNVFPQENNVESIEKAKLANQKELETMFELIRKMVICSITNDNCYIDISRNKNLLVIHRRKGKRSRNKKKRYSNKNYVNLPKNLRR